MHHLPKDVDPSTLPSALGRLHLNGRNDTHSPPPEDFPALNHPGGVNAKARRGGFSQSPHDPSLNDAGHGRFAAAVKKSGPAGHTVHSSESLSTSASKDPGSLAPRNGSELTTSTAVVAPRPSTRIKLRPPTLMPNISTGEAVKSLYAAYRTRAQQLGASRNESLARAAAAMKKGDGAAAKRFTREGHDLNAKMSAELVQAAGRLVRERAKHVEQTLKNSVWSDDSTDRPFAPGKICGAGFGVCLGVAAQAMAGQAAVEGKKLTPDERTEVLIDLHGLQVAEATEVVEEFLLAVSDGLVGLHDGTLLIEDFLH